MSGGAPVPGKDTSSGSTMGSSTTDTAGRTKTDTSNVGTSNMTTQGTTSTAGSSTSDVLATPTMPDWVAQALQGGYAGSTDLTKALSDAAMGYTANPVSLDELAKSASGYYLTGPGRDEALTAISDRLTPQVTSIFGSAGRSNNFLGADALARTISDSYLTNVFNPERSRMDAAAAAIPGIQLSQTFDPLSRALAGQSEQLGFLTPFIGQRTTGQTTTDQIVNALQNAFGTTTSNTTSNTEIDQLVKAMQQERQKQASTSTPSYFPGSDIASIGGGILGLIGTLGGFA